MKLRNSDASAIDIPLAAPRARFLLPQGRGDEVTHAGDRPGRSEVPLKGLHTRDIYISDLHVDATKVRTRDLR